jgi:hypothetical protein
MLDQCLLTVKDDARIQSYRGLADSARKALAQHPRGASREDAAENDLMLAVKLWKKRQELCSSLPATDEPVARVLARLARE